ncbi:MAG TPA: inositol monophosphatase family protein, partial [Candidatus Glassbacteria bacterium]|nr:inositol monophosphatase family protein [Candidatus Glassbacteria bacterium]
LFAEQGKGAWLRRNGKDQAISPGPGSNTLWVGGRGELVANITRAVMLDRRWYVWQFSSSIAYAYLAAGRIAGLIHIAPHLSSVHTAAGCFIAEEAGARVYDFERNRDWDLDTRSYLLSATPELHETLLGIINDCREQR